MRVGLIVATIGVAAAQGAPATRVIVERAAAYVDTYTRELRFVLADAESVQRLYGRGGALVTERRLRGEMYLAFLPVDRVWIAVHDVSHVDDAEVAREDLVGLLRQGAVSAVARRVANRNAAFNLGSITRNFTEPTLPLLLLVPPRLAQVRFDRRALDLDAGAMTLAFRERDRPTLVRTQSGGPVYSRGTMRVDIATGRLESTSIELDADGVRARHETTYARDRKIEMWVPMFFRERYERGPEIVTVESTYANYRRFEVLARIK